MENNANPSTHIGTFQHLDQGIHSMYGILMWIIEVVYIYHLCYNKFIINWIKQISQRICVHYILLHRGGGGGGGRGSVVGNIHVLFNRGCTAYKLVLWNIKGVCAVWCGVV